MKQNVRFGKWYLLYFLFSGPSICIQILFRLLISKNKKFSFKNDDQIAYKDEFPEDIKIEKIFTLINTIAGFLHDKN